MVRAILDVLKTQTRRVVKPRKDRTLGCMLTPKNWLEKSMPATS
jgi:hypothetical protein